MKIQRHEIINLLHEQWPHLVDGHSAGGHIWIPRNRYFAPTRKQFEGMVNAAWNPIAKDVGYIPDIFMCTNFAATLAVASDFYVLQLMALNQLDPQVKAEWAIGEVWGTRFRGNEVSHAIAGVFLDIDGYFEMWLMEPQPERKEDGSVDFRAWKADAVNDQVHFFKL